MARLNWEFLRHRGPTDVLTFDLCERTKSRHISGEIVICADVAKKQAREHGHTVEAEMTLYVVHGLLHLLGFGDKTKRDFKIMHEEEDRIMESLGLGAVFAPIRPTPGTRTTGRRSARNMKSA